MKSKLKQPCSLHNNHAENFIVHVISFKPGLHLKQYELMLLGHYIKCAIEASGLSDIAICIGNQNNGLSITGKPVMTAKDWEYWSNVAIKQQTLHAFMEDAGVGPIFEQRFKKLLRKRFKG